MIGTLDPAVWERGQETPLTIRGMMDTPHYYFSLELSRHLTNIEFPCSGVNITDRGARMGVISSLKHIINHYYESGFRDSNRFAHPPPHQQTARTG